MDVDGHISSWQHYAHYTRWQHHFTVPKTILYDLISLEGVEPHDIMPGGVVYFQLAMLSALLILFGLVPETSEVFAVQIPR